MNSIFAAWKILKLREWNTSSELCSGPAIDDSIKIDDQAYNPFIKCDCTFNSSTICRITALYSTVSLYVSFFICLRVFTHLMLPSCYRKVFGKDAVGPIPPQLWTLIYLENLYRLYLYLCSFSYHHKRACKSIQYTLKSHASFSGI